MADCSTGVLERIAERTLNPVQCKDHRNTAPRIAGESNHKSLARRARQMRPPDSRGAEAPSLLWGARGAVCSDRRGQ
eukprot:2769663-Alexandrium_andersonii.AAC.1